MKLYYYQFVFCLKKIVKLFRQIFKKFKFFKFTVIYCMFLNVHKYTTNFSIYYFALIIKNENLTVPILLE